MKNPGWSFPVFLRYALWQLPGLAVFITTLLLILHWANLPRWLVWIGVALWMVKDCFFFPRVWRAYDRDPSGTAHSMVGEKGVAETPLHPKGFVRVHSELWRAEVALDEVPIERGQPIQVKRIQGLTLIVRLDGNGAEIELQESRRDKPDANEHG